MFCAGGDDASPPPLPSHHPWLKECSGKRGTRDRRSEALIRTALCVVSLFPLSCVRHIRSETAFDEYLQGDLRLIKSSNLARYVILSLVIWEFNSLAEGVGGACGVYQLTSIGPVHWNREFQGCLIDDWPGLSITLLVLFFVILCFKLHVWMWVWVYCKHGSGPVFPLSYTSNHGTIIPQP